MARWGLRVSLGLGLLATICVAIAETGRMPVDNPAAHLELTMVHEAMVLEYSGRHLALIEWGAALKLLLWMTLICAIFFPAGIAVMRCLAAVLGGWGWPPGSRRLARSGRLALRDRDVSIAKMRVFRVPQFLGAAILLALLAAVFLFVSQGFA